MTTVFVTGVAGFIGSHLAERLLERGDTVVGLDNLNDYYPVAFKRRNLQLLAKSPHFTFIEGDLVDSELVLDTMRRFRVERCAHIAARAGVRPSISDPFLYQQVNVQGTLSVLEAARLAGVAHTVVTSSSSVYGNSTAVPFREDDTATDRPISPYAATKKAAEVLSYTYHHLYGMSISIVRPFTVYGPRGRPDMAPWIFLQSALSGTPIRRFGDGSTRRDYTYIDDFVSGFIQALDRSFGFEIFNLGNSNTVSLSEALEIVARVTGRTLVIQELPMQPGDVQITNADLTKSRALLGYAPNTSFEHGMRRFHEWFCSAERG